MFGELAVFYLFLGGTGAGTVAVACFVDLFLVRQPFGTSAYMQGPSVDPVARMVDYGFLTGLVLLFAGTACLVFDLGRTDRVLSLFINPYPTPMTVGSYALAVSLVLAAALAAVRFFYLPSVRRWMVVVLEWMAVADALVVVAYTGVLLATIGGVPLWKSWLLPALFVFSSGACGLAAFAAAAVFLDRTPAVFRMAVLLARADAAIIIVEAVTAAAFLLQSAQSPNPGTAAGFVELMSGDSAFLWWFGFVVCGMTVPFAIDAVMSGGRVASRKLLAIAVALVLAGGLCMRFALVDAGDHRELTLGDPAVEYLEGPPLYDLTLQEPVRLG